MSFKVKYDKKNDTYIINKKGKKVAVIEDEYFTLDFLSFFLKLEKHSNALIGELSATQEKISVNGSTLTEVLLSIIDCGAVIISIGSMAESHFKKTCFVVTDGILFNYNSIRKLIGRGTLDLLIKNDQLSKSPILVKTQSGDLLYDYKHAKNTQAKGFIVKQYALGLDLEIKECGAIKFVKKGY